MNYLFIILLQVAGQVAAQTGCRVVGVEGNKDEHNAAVARQQAFNAKVHSLLQSRPLVPHALTGREILHPPRRWQKASGTSKAGQSSCASTFSNRCRLASGRLFSFLPRKSVFDRSAHPHPLFVVASEATVVFINNLTLSPVQNQRVRRMLVFNLQHGPTRVVSLQCASSALGL